MDCLAIELAAQDIPFDARDNHIMCFPHVINIAVTHLTKSFTDPKLASDESELSDHNVQAHDRDPIALCRGTVCSIRASGK
jgi:hypothetical protein